MWRVVALFVGILTMVRATPFDLDSFDRPNPFRDNVEFGNDAFSEDSDYKDDYEIGTFKSGENSNVIDESDKSGSRQAIADLFGHVLDCELVDNQNPPQEGCVHTDDGNVYFLHVLSAVDIEDVYKAFKDASIEECEVGEDVSDLTEDGCFWIDEENASVTWFGFYDDDAIDEVGEMNIIWGMVENLDKCNMTATEIPKEGCALFNGDDLHLINVLTEDNIDDVLRALSNLDLRECLFDEGHVLITNDPCYEIDVFINSIHLFNLPSRPEGVQDDDEENSKATYEIPDAELSPLYSVQTVTGDELSQLKLKDAKNSKAVLSKKIKSRKQPQVQKILGRRGHQHGCHGNNEGRVNHRPKWMKYLQTND